MKGKTISIPIKTITMEADEQYDLKKVSLKLLKSGAVPSHGLYMNEECLETIRNSIHLKPILCAYEKDEDGNETDFMGHEIEYQITREGKTVTIKKIYIEQPVGVLEDKNFQVQEIDNESWITCDGFLYKEYCEPAVKILEEADGEKAVSIEFTILDGEENKEDGLYHVTNVHFLGVTLLGESHTPAITGANCVNFTQEQSALFATQFSKIVDSVNKLNENKGGQTMAKKKRKCSLCEVEFEVDKSFKDEDIFTCETCTTVELENNQKFAKSNQAISTAIREAVNSYTTEITNRWGEKYTSQKYYTHDIIIEDNIVICEDNQCYYAYYGIPFIMENDKAIVDFEKAVRYIQGDWRAYEGETAIEVNPMLSKEIDTVVEKLEVEVKAKEDIQLELDNTKVKFTELQTTNEENVKELERLKTFETEILTKQKEEEVNVVVEKFSELKEIEGFEEIINERMNLSREDLETKLKVFAFDNGVILGRKVNKKPNKDSQLIKTNNQTFSEDKLTEAEKRYGTSVKRFLDN